MLEDADSIYLIFLVYFKLRTVLSDLNMLSLLVVLQKHQIFMM